LELDQQLNLFAKRKSSESEKKHLKKKYKNLLKAVKCWNTGAVAGGGAGRGGQGSSL